MLMISGTSVVLLTALGLVAGVLGSLLGIGGGVLIVPALALGWGFDVHVAVATSLVSVVATSTATGSAYVGSGLTNMRLGMTLEIATTLGGITGGLLATSAPSQWLLVLFGVMLAVTAVLMVLGHEHGEHVEPAEGQHLQGSEERGRLAGSFLDPVAGGMVAYHAERLLPGSLLSLLAGGLSGLLGVGGGFLKVPAISLVMRVPLRVAAATSNFMIGVTAVSSLFVYFERGYVHPKLAAPIVLGVTVGAWVGIRLAGRLRTRTLRTLFALLLVAIAVEMIANGVHPGG